MEDLPTLEYFLNNPNAAYWLVLAAIGIAMLASLNVKMTFAKYNKVISEKRVSASEIARQILDSHGLYDVVVETTHGKLTDHYDPRCNTVRLSESTFSSYSVGAIGIAAHECGHAIQHAEQYTPIRIRHAIFPVVNIANRTWIYLVIAGMFFPLFPGTAMIYIGIISFALTILFQLLTLPVEFDASRRAMAVIAGYNILQTGEQRGARKVLKAAAMTYIAALLVSLAQLIRLIAILNRRR
ncbi:MAG: zinc metallopeptidase [Oscillospiraceae bacterium]|nr:zinc metallopeptidase [Oscillospiraceae bacterium]